MQKIDAFWKDSHCVLLSTGAVDFLLPSLSMSMYL